MKNLLTDIAGVRVGHADDAGAGVRRHRHRLRQARRSPRSTCAAAARASRDTALLDPVNTVERIDAIALSGGSAFGLDAGGGVQAWLAEQGRGFRSATRVIPIVPGAILFRPAERRRQELGPLRALSRPRLCRGRCGRRRDFALGSVGAGFGATTANLKGGLGSASAATPGGIRVAALCAVNAIGSVTVGDGPHFWAAPFEQDGEFGGRGLPPPFTPDMLHDRASRAARRERSREHHARASSSPMRC